MATVFLRLHMDCMCLPKIPLSVKDSKIGHRFNNLDIHYIKVLPNKYAL